MLAAVADSQYWYRMHLLGIRVRTSLTAAIYRKALKLSNKAKKNYTGNESKAKNDCFVFESSSNNDLIYCIAGELVNLISVDCQKLEEATMFITFIWSCPLQIGLALYFLYLELGSAVFAG